MTKISVGLLVLLTIILILLLSVRANKGKEGDVAKDKRFVQRYRCMPWTKYYYVRCRIRRKYRKDTYRKCGWWGRRRCKTGTKYFWKFEWSRCRKPCPGKWSNWSSWRKSGGCTGTGLLCIGRQRIYRTRTCTGPSNGRRPCRGPSIQRFFRACKPAHTQVNGNWSGWGRWRPIGACSKRCGRGKRLMMRERTCTQPAPRCGGRPCFGSSRQRKYKSCRRKRCKVDGKWSGWGNWGHFRACSETCGRGVRYRYRYRACDNPKPQYGGKKCPGPLKDEDFKKCFVQKCPKISSGKDGPLNKESTTNQTSTITSGQNSSGNRTETKT